MHRNFYEPWRFDPTKSTSNTEADYVECRSCLGNGVIFGGPMVKLTADAPVDMRCKPEAKL